VDQRDGGVVAIRARSRLADAALLPPPSDRAAPPSDRAAPPSDRAASLVPRPMLSQVPGKRAPRHGREDRQMTDLAIGRACRTVRRRLGWRQVDLAARAGVSQPLISDIERGFVARVSLHTLRRVLAALEIDLVLVARWRGGELDRMLYEDHSAIVEAVTRRLRREGWDTAAEVTFSVYGERGSIDILAWHPPTRSLLVIEVKTMIASAEETLRRLDVKVRLARQVGQERFSASAESVARLLVVADTTTNRRRVARLVATGATTMGTNRQVRRWLRSPSGDLRGTLFVQAPGRARSGSRRVRHGGAASAAPACRPR
jgi:transcriptional regulator with XRE-family HTH domain